MLAHPVALEPPPVEESSEYLARAEQLEQAQTELEATEAEIADAQEQVTSVEGDLPAREQAVSEAQAALAERESAVAAQEEDVASREEAVGVTEDRVAANTVPGDGTFVVGDDMAPGTYRSDDNSADCYWQTSSDPNGSDIIANDIGRPGTRFAEVGAGQYFQTSTCTDWVLE